MRVKSLTAVLFSAVLIAAAVGWGGWWSAHAELKQLVFTHDRLLFLERETTRLQRLLAAQHEAADLSESKAQRREIEARVAVLRGMTFLRPVSYREVPRADLPTILRQKLGQQVPDQEFDHTSVALAALGLIPPGMDLKKTYLSLLGEQVGAFYDQHSQELFTFSGHSLASSENQVILAHELTHALEDQRFGLARLPLEAKGNDDRALAASALVEGDATLVMNQFMLDHLSAATLRESLGSALTTDVRQLAAAPRYLRETLVFPYLRGQEFCQALYVGGGWASLARAFEKPPSSTSQILHPERFLAQPREEPVSVEFPSGTLLGKVPIADNVLGEFGLRQLLQGWLKDDRHAAQVAAGWQGDRYVVFGDAKASSYAWEIVLRSPDETAKFAQAAILGLHGQKPLEQAKVSAVGQNWKNGDRCSLVVADTTRKRVLILSAQDANWYEALKSRFAIGFSDIDHLIPTLP